MSARMRNASYNLSILGFVAVPLWIVTEWIIAGALPSDGSASSFDLGRPGDALQAFVLEFIVIVIPVLIGGVIHQIGLAFFPGKATPLVQRVWAVLTSPICFVAVLIVTARPSASLSWRTVVAAAGALMIYSLLLKPLGAVERG